VEVYSVLKQRCWIGLIAVDCQWTF